MVLRFSHSNILLFVTSLPRSLSLLGRPRLKIYNQWAIFKTFLPSLVTPSENTLAAGALPTPSPVGVAFYRDITMSHAGEPDPANRSNCAMCAATVCEIVDNTSCKTNYPLEIVNLDVEACSVSPAWGAVPHQVADFRVKNM